MIVVSDDDEVVVQVSTSKSTSSSARAQSPDANALKRLKSTASEVEIAWTPKTEARHCESGKDYLRKTASKSTQIFNYMQLTSRDAHSNWESLCLCCESVRKASSTSVLLDHFTSCSFSAVEAELRDETSAQIRMLATRRRDAVSKDMKSASERRKPSSDAQTTKRADSIATHFKSQPVLRENVLQQTAAYFVGANLPAAHAESEHYRTLLYVASGKTLKDSVLEVLSRSAVNAQMKTFATEVVQKSQVEWKVEASKFGSTLLVDGWTGRRAEGAVGLEMASLTTRWIPPVQLTDTDRSRAQDYEQKLEAIVPWEHVIGICTDGASNMVSLGEALPGSRFLLPVLCAAHGFSLIVHYMAKAFEDRCNLFSRTAGIISFFSRSPLRTANLVKSQRQLDASRTPVTFIGFCKTRMAYQSLSLMRVFRLRQAARMAMIAIKASSVEEEDAQIDTFSRMAQVEKSLEDDKLFADIEIFCRASFPVLLAMREVDRGTPMIGFVYWLFYHVQVQVKLLFERLESSQASLKRLGDQLCTAVTTVWDKRHKPVLSFAYLTNPAFHADLVKESNVFELDPNFSGDVESVLVTLSRKRFTGQRNENGMLYTDREILAKAAIAKQELSTYLASPLSDLAEVESCDLLASKFWTISSTASRFPLLAWCASRVHAMATVTSDLERFFSHVANVQTVQRASLKVEHAALFAAAQKTLTSCDNRPKETEVQSKLIALVRRCEALETENDFIQLDIKDGFAPLHEWLERRANKANVGDGGLSGGTSDHLEDLNNDGNPCDEDEETGELAQQVDAAVDAGEARRSGRSRREPRRLNL